MLSFLCCVVVSLPRPRGDICLHIVASHLLVLGKGPDRMACHTREKLTTSMQERRVCNENVFFINE